MEEQNRLSKAQFQTTLDRPRDADDLELYAQIQISKAGPRQLNSLQGRLDQHPPGKA